MAAPPAAGDRGLAGVAVVPQQVLREMLLHAEDQGAAVPLRGGQRNMRTRTLRGGQRNIRTRTLRGGQRNMRTRTL